METSLPQYKPNQSYGFFGYPSFCCDLAVQRDNAQMAQECWENGWMDLETRTIFGLVIDKCEKDAPSVAKKLKELGPCKSAPLMAPYIKS